MKDRLEQTGRWFYRGIWAVLVRWFRVPPDPPTLPVFVGDAAQTFRPASGFLSLLKFQFWIGTTIWSGVLLVAWMVTTILEPLAGAIILLPTAVLALFPPAVAYIALHLRYDTTWYVMTARSLRIRRGIWIIHETTITFEKVQNIAVVQGPIERLFGIGNVLVQTAGGGGQPTPEGKGASLGMHRGLVEGVAEPARIRDLILPHVRQSQSAGLGDDGQSDRQWQAEHLAALREIRDAARRLALASS